MGSHLHTTVEKDHALLYGGNNNHVNVHLQSDSVKNTAHVSAEIQAVGVIVIGVDGMRQDVLYESATYDADKNDCGGESCYVEPAKLSGLCEAMGGRYKWGLFSNTCDYSKWSDKHIKLNDVTAIFPSITLASWASIFSGKTSNETGMMGNEFFARDVYTQNKAIPGMEKLPKGMITLSSGAFKNDSPNFMANNLVPADYVVKGMNEGYSWWEPFAELGPTTYRTLQNKFDDSSPNNAWQAESIYEWINGQPGINNRYNKETVKNDLNKSCLKNGKECRSAAISHIYAKGTDYWSTPSSRLLDGLTPKLMGEAYFLDSMAANGAKHFLDEYKGKRFPALMTIYFAGLDHEAHGDATSGGMGKYKEFFTKTADAKIKEVIDKLKAKGEFENKIFIVTADHGHTGMAEGLKYEREQTSVDADGNSQTVIDYPSAEMSCELKLDFQIDPKNPNVGRNKQKAELYNNNLHIWELATLFQQFGSAEGLKLLVPKEIEKTIISELKNGETPAVTSDIEKANVIAALNGPMAHVYVKGASGWGAANGDPVMLGRVADKLKMYFGENGAALLPEEKKPFPRLLSSLDKILVRTDGQYKVFAGITTDTAGNITGLATPGALTDLNTEYVDAANRITKMNNLNRSGDIVLLMRSGSGDPPDNRYSSGVSCKSWHGSLNKTDSYVPFIVGYPGGRETDIDPLIKAVCPNGQCEGNWKLSDIVKKIIETQYSGQ